MTPLSEIQKGKVIPPKLLLRPDRTAKVVGSSARGMVRISRCIVDFWSPDRKPHSYSLDRMYVRMGIAFRTNSLLPRDDPQVRRCTPSRRTADDPRLNLE